MPAPEPSDHASALRGLSGVLDLESAMDSANEPMDDPDPNIDAVINEEMEKVTLIDQSVSCWHIVRS